LFDRLAEEGRLTPAIMTDVAHAIARFHKQAPVTHEGSGSGNIARVMDINEAGFATSRVFPPAELDLLFTQFRAALAVHAGHLDRRAVQGEIRRCHGDLHLRNICLLDDGPKLFDCIEFNEEIATIDILYDLAFLLMDLWHRDLKAFANLVMNRYLDETGEEEGFALLPFFMAIRAAVRAHVTATQAAETDEKAGALIETARSYKDLAQSLLGHAPPRLIAIGGLSGSGKSTIAELVAPELGDPPGARFLETDRIRKAMFGVSAETRLDAEAYRPEVSARVYDVLARRSIEIARQGGTVAIAAVFDRPDDRARIEEGAHKANVPFTGLWLDADAETLRQRVQGRRGGPSDANDAVLEKQLRGERGDIRWQRIDARPSPPDVARAVLVWLAEGKSS
jgi:predicted kinase